MTKPRAPRPLWVVVGEDGRPTHHIAQLVYTDRWRAQEKLEILLALGGDARLFKFVAVKARKPRKRGRRAQK